jgi:hypothetical protein
LQRGTSVLSDLGAGFLPKIKEIIPLKGLLFTILCQQRRKKFNQKGTSPDSFFSGAVKREGAFMDMYSIFRVYGQGLPAQAE